MKKKKRFLSLALALVLCLGLLPTAAMAAGSGFTIKDGVLIKYTGPGGDVVIPDSVNAIGRRAFADCSMTSIVIPDSVTTIGEFVFTNCDNLTDVTIPDSVTTIGDNAFLNCASLTSITIPDSVTAISDNMFYNCENLTDVTIPDSVTKIGNGAFEICTRLTSVAIPDSVTYIGGGAFQGCTSLTGITISDSVTYMNSGVFYGCTGLTSMTIPNSMRFIAGYTFDGCTNLTNVTIPASVTSIGDRAFNGCTGLTDVYYGGTQEQWGAIEIKSSNDPLQSATIHYSSSGPVPTATAYASTQEVLVDGMPVTFSCYALKDAAGNMTNYIKLRDLADILNGTLAQFAVGWDGVVTITTKTAYTPNGSEGSTPFSGDRAYEETDAETKVNGQAADLDTITLNDDAGGGYIYYQLRDLGQLLGFNVGWDGSNIYVETDKPYDPAN